MSSYELYFIKDRSATKNNVYIIIDKSTKIAAIIDPACELDQVNEIIKKKDLNLSMILITHTHADHVRINDELVKKYHCSVYVAAEEVKYSHYMCANMRLFLDNDIIWLGRTYIKCMVTPGHTNGSTCFLLADSCFTGDTLFIEGCGMCIYEDSSPIKMFQSITRIKEEIDGNIHIYPGHTYDVKPGQTFDYLMNNNIYLVIDDLPMFINFRMRNLQTNVYNFI